MVIKIASRKREGSHTYFVIVHALKRKFRKNDILGVPSSHSLLVNFYRVLLSYESQLKT